MVDADGDRQPDSWETGFFGTTNAVAGGPTDDFDGDGTRNLDEYSGGTNPADSNSVFNVQLRVLQSDPVVRFDARAAAGPSYAGTARYYALESAHDIASPAPEDWSGVPGYTNLLGQDHTVTYPDTSGNRIRHFRARAWLE